jgi:hypothetical protein
MARKEEARIIHPRQIQMSLDAFHADTRYLMGIARHVQSCVTDDSLDAERVRKAVAPQLQEAIDRMAKWYDAD